jgi:flagellar basal-body rod protein FlgC
MELGKSMAISASGLKAQSVRMRVIAENLANQDSVAPAPGVDPYRRKVASFRTEIDRQSGQERVVVDKVIQDRTAFGRRYMPGHPAADPNGYVNVPNVNGIVEATDMREAQRTYEANLSAIESAKSMLMRTVDLLR